MTVIFAYPGSGKTTLAMKNKNFIDLEVSAFKYPEKDLSYSEKEKLKSSKRKITNKSYVKDYIEEVFRLHKEDKQVLTAVTFLPAILFILLVNLDFDWHIYIPKLHHLKEYLRRYTERGNLSRFRRQALFSWIVFLPILNLVSYICPKITRMKKANYLEYYLVKENLDKKQVYLN